MKTIILSIIFLYTVRFASGQADTIYSQANIHPDTFRITGEYEGKSCIRISECVIHKLRLKKNHKYVEQYIGNNHGRINKGTYKGTWKLDGDILILTETQSSDKEEEEENEKELDRYKIVNGNLWYFNPDTNTPSKLALFAKRNGKLPTTQVLQIKY